MSKRGGLSEVTPLEITILIVKIRPIKNLKTLLQEDVSPTRVIYGYVPVPKNQQYQ